MNLKKMAVEEILRLRNQLQCGRRIDSFIAEDVAPEAVVRARLIGQREDGSGSVGSELACQSVEFLRSYSRAGDLLSAQSGID